ncbi:lytic transglycosylase domain-containing protein [Microbulbifer rhizosphaerae]|uniref:Soluble lytic murein transglycosylase-like protein n=1 Tax=Microbulbifer rhizosphaerae TaxID=1562603 RepID=A0A7W4WEI6_9GAMM|nr:lytic transglycosylase domain-containing protein [Microbulbifer rhizosphaerae]MBB3062769.1 soluble lytic murein transglycosylase-like protein [Microbulbifer rhizosphaerae]
MIRKSLTTLLLSLIFAGAQAQVKVPEIDPELRLALKEAITQADSFTDRFDAEVWLMSKSQPLARYIKDPKERMHVLKAVHREATLAGLRPEIVLAVIQIESAFDPYAVSRVGAQGMMQVMPFWKKEIGRPDDNLIDMDTNLRYGCTILKHYIGKAKGNLANALAYYNGSYGRHTYSSKVLDAWASRWR